MSAEERGVDYSQCPEHPLLRCPRCQGLNCRCTGKLHICDDCGYDGTTSPTERWTMAAERLGSPDIIDAFALALIEFEGYWETSTQAAQRLSAEIARLLTPQDETETR